MITNDLVLIGGSDASPVCHVDVNAAMPGVNTEEGIDITKLFPTNAVRKDDRMVFWKMTWLPAGNHQGTETGLPYLTGDYEGGLAGQTGTMTGYENRVDFTRLRYYDGGWEFYLDAELNAWNTTQKWGKDTNGDGTITADEFGGWYPVTPTETDLDIMPGVAAGEGQIVAYYLQVTDVTREVITNVADWGPAIDDSRNIGYGIRSAGFCGPLRGRRPQPQRDRHLPLFRGQLQYRRREVHHRQDHGLPLHGRLGRC